jgi:2-keto-4-pentenoate hydratase/2-oxohepta-3-ene-1,7-dioic acid hydratase in catechol pathway
MPLEKGDLILTGTPKGVSQIFEGDTIEVGLEQCGNRLLHGKWNTSGYDINVKLM